MKIVKGSIAASAMMIGAVAAAYGQSVTQPGATGAAAVNGAPSGMTNNAGATAGTGPSTAAGMSPMSPGAGTMGGVRAGPALNTMRANGTSLNANPDPRVPNFAGRGAPPPPRN
ncbi:hypothetical protein B0G80_5666 [Paraburkholderia sp. BL6669N2]|uniref:hypothetical protein n=1 Tax=Paraburkholderia sp. BL6669N2 TaxID=1938807 RepID=UPI000E26011B|nr:hypothetical protein [Paraburkholderia sp. BL6669N2]REG49309.1 hypothetical protein B0G80_5666 [Paraburkholderia sp. BL6669N2]